MRLFSKLFVAGALALSVPAQGAIIDLFSGLTGSQEVPPNASTATGFAHFQYDDVAKTFDMVLTVTGIPLTRLREGSGANTTSIHIHRAPAGVNGPIEIDLGWYGEQAVFNPAGFGNPSGWVVGPGATIMLTLDDVPLHQDIQGLLNIADTTTLAVLENALLHQGLYVNVHTCTETPCLPTTPSPFSGGEIRGQIPEPASIALMALGLLGIAGMRRRST